MTTGIPHDEAWENFQRIRDREAPPAIEDIEGLLDAHHPDRDPDSVVTLPVGVNAGDRCLPFLVEGGAGGEPDLDLIRIAALAFCARTHTGMRVADHLWQHAGAGDDTIEYASAEV